MDNSINLNSKMSELLSPRRTGSETLEPIQEKVKTSPVAFENQPTLKGDNVLQLQELQDFTAIQLQIQKKEDIDLGGVPRLSWLKGRNDRLYYEKVAALSYGASIMKNFSEIIERNRGCKIVSKEDWNTVERNIYEFEWGMQSYQRNRAENSDPVVHKVIDYLEPKTQQRLNLLKEFLHNKTKSSEDQPSFPKLPDPVIKTAEADSTDELLGFLAKDQQWYKWYLEDMDDTIDYSPTILQFSTSQKYIVA